jgi:hypothetical protein
MDQPAVRERRYPRRIVIGAVAVIASLGLFGLVSVKVNNTTFLSTAATEDTWVEARASSWNGAAKLVIAKLKAAGVKRGQIISIDAHNNAPTGKAIFSGHYSKQYPSKGELDITYHVQNSQTSWATHYNNADTAVKSDFTDLICITSSINSGNYAVTYAFSYSTPASNAESQTLTWVEARENYWSDAAKSIIKKIRDSGAKRGQVVGIDAHNNGCSDTAIMSAVLDLNAPGYGDLDIDYQWQNRYYSWNTFYNTAAKQAKTYANNSVISFTSSCNENGRAVSFVFYYK